MAFSTMIQRIPNLTLKIALILPIAVSALTKILPNLLLLILEEMYLYLPRVNKIFSHHLYLKSLSESQFVPSHGVMILIRLSLAV